MTTDPSPPDGSPGSSLESTFNLLALAKAGDAAALDLLFSRHLKPLKRWASGRLPRWARDLTDTDDLVQDALVQTFRNIDAFEARSAGALQAYLRQAVLNRIRDELRRKARRPDVRPVADEDADGSLSPLERAIGREWIALYERALATLKPEDREAIIGRLEMGYTYAELAGALGKPTADAARKTAERALVRLAEELSRVRR